MVRKTVGHSLCVNQTGSKLGPIRCQLEVLAVIPVRCYPNTLSPVGRMSSKHASSVLFFPSG
jgi:hypothetical protein